MSFSFFDRSKANQQGDKRRQNNPNRKRNLRLESLEDRRVLSADFAAGQLLVQFKPMIAENAKAEVLASVAAQVQERVQTAAMRAAGQAGFEVLKPNHIARFWELIKKPDASAFRLISAAGR